MLSLISAMCHKLQRQSIQPFWPHPTCCHTEKNETVGEIFAEQRLSFVKTYVAKKVCFYFYGSWERGKWRNIACLHSCAGIRWFQTSETCQHHKLIKITNLSTSQTCQHHNFVNITNLSNTTYNMSTKSSKSEVGGCHQKCTSLLTTMTRGHCLLICVCQPSVTGNLSSPAAKRSRPSIQVQEEPFGCWCRW